MAELLSSSEYINGIISGNTSILSRAITLIESVLPQHRAIALKVLEGCYPYAGYSIRIGITGVPGVGKSTFIEAIGNCYINAGKRVAVLAIDPSSKQSGGSILGDKVRMDSLSINHKAFIRPSASGTTLGGIAASTRESILLCEAAGMDVILIETVGVGQSETEVSTMVDYFLLLMLAGAGDELQGIKRGIMEIADGLFINKADGSNFDKAEEAANQYRNALHLFPVKKSGLIPVVKTCSSIENTGIEEIKNVIEQYIIKSRTTNFFEQNRNNQNLYWFNQATIEALRQNLMAKKGMNERSKQLEQQIINKKISPIQAVALLLKM